MHLLYQDRDLKPRLSLPHIALSFMMNEYRIRQIAELHLMELIANLHRYRADVLVHQFVWFTGVAHHLPVTDSTFLNCYLFLLVCLQLRSRTPHLPVLRPAPHPQQGSVGGRGEGHDGSDCSSSDSNGSGSGSNERRVGFLSVPGSNNNNNKNNNNSGGDGGGNIRRKRMSVYTPMSERMKLLSDPNTNAANSVRGQGKSVPRLSRYASDNVREVRGYTLTHAHFYTFILFLLLLFL